MNAEKVLVPMLICHACKMGDISSLSIIANEYGSLLSVGDYDRRTPLHIAASENQIELVKLVISNFYLF